MTGPILLKRSALSVLRRDVYSSNCALAIMWLPSWVTLLTVPGTKEVPLGNLIFKSSPFLNLMMQKYLSTVISREGPLSVGTVM